MLWLGKTPLQWPQTSSVHTTPTTRARHRVKSTSKLVSVRPITATLTVHEIFLSSLWKWKMILQTKLQLKFQRLLVPQIYSKIYVCLLLSTFVSFGFENATKGIIKSYKFFWITVLRTYVCTRFYFKLQLNTLQRNANSKWMSQLLCRLFSKTITHRSRW